MEWLKKNWKKILIGIMVPIVMAMVAAAAASIWYFFIRSTPERVMEATIQAARERNVEDFKKKFSPTSIRALEGSWTGETVGKGGSWVSMMEGVLETNGAPPEIIEEEIVEDRAPVKLRLSGRRRTVFMVQDGPKWNSIWRIDVLSGIDAGLSEEARKVVQETSEDPEADKKKKALLEEPKKDGWWKKDKDKEPQKEDE